MIGSSSYLFDVFAGAGEASDFVWAPMEGWILSLLYGSNRIGMLGFTEEILPLTDIIPTATFAWVLDTWVSKGNAPPGLEAAAEYLNIKPKGSDDLSALEIHTALMDCLSKMGGDLRTDGLPVLQGSIGEAGSLAGSEAASQSEGDPDDEEGTEPEESVAEERNPTGVSPQNRLDKLETALGNLHGDGSLHLELT
eukprot:gnl/TRDRNA2_/TRDRNA2_127101_c2_seq1.p1 gnl/TRDRNA2_/TRDRNA2_127101_c2~~gnl/TRDRNA2_/TRDRNA2_127101_c2_seq1.p1  ORF type:complete len:222 (-),score=32.72 gnl/TRDRNA2_/TRDRNA2_127101_c2_seq1:297-881(-)